MDKKLKKFQFYTNHNHKAIQLLAVKRFVVEPLMVNYLYTKFERIMRGVGIFLVYLTWNYPHADFQVDGYHGCCVFPVSYPHS